MAQQRKGSADRRQSAGRRTKNGVHAVDTLKTVVEEQANTIEEMKANVEAKTDTGSVADIDSDIDPVTGEILTEEQVTARLEAAKKAGEEQAQPPQPSPQGEVPAGFDGKTEGETVTTSTALTDDTEPQPQDLRARDTGFQLRPGDGWLFYQVGRDNIHVYQGHLKLGDGRELQVIAKLDTELKNYTCTLRHFGDQNWTPVAHFTLPMLGTANYVETKVTIPTGKLLPPQKDGDEPTVETRDITVRAFKGQTKDGEDVLRFRIPEDRRGAARGRNVPM